MKTSIVIVLCLLVSSAAFAFDSKTPKLDPYNYEPFGDVQSRMDSGFDNSWNNNSTFNRPYKQNAYGHGVHSDATGKPFTWQTQQGIRSNGPVKNDGYGQGVGMDQYGRPAKPKSW